MADIVIEIVTKAGIKALKYIYSLTKKGISDVQSLDENIELLRKNLPRVKELMLNAQALILNDDTSSQSSRLLDSEDFVKGLKQFIYNGEDIIDKFDLKDRKGQMNNTRKLRIANKLNKLCAEFEELKEKNQNAKFPELPKNNLGGLEDEVDNRLSLWRKPSIGVIQRNDFNMEGRVEDKKWLRHELLENNIKLSVVLLTGMGGIGKTTLAHDILRDPEIVSHFEFRKLVTVGDQNLDPKKVLNHMIDGDADTLNKATEKVQSFLEGKKRFLIVLDDVWEAKDLKHRWNELWAPLSYGSEESRVIVTTREEDIKYSMERLKPRVRKLEILSDEECLKIFESFAFPDEFDIDLREIGKQIVKKKVKGIPLAARVIGSSLNGKKKEYWNVALTQIKERGINSAILWSYLNLPMHLKQCFVYCSLFPKDTHLDKTQIVRLWMAHSFVVESNTQHNGELTLVDIGEGYLDALLNASLLQVAEDGEYDDEYIMHDLIHDFALNILGDEFSKVKDTMKSLRHLIIEKNDQALLQNHPDIKNLCTFMSKDPHHIDNFTRDQLKTVKSLSLGNALHDEYYRVSNTFVTTLFKKLSQVRYLDISGISISTLPELICNMRALQTLILNYNDTIQFPKDMSKELTELHHIEAGYNISSISGLGQLKKLHSIGGVFMLDKDKWHCIEELRNLTKLRGRLCIEGLCHVQWSQLVCKKQLLKEHKHLEELVFDMDGNTESKVLNYLEPHENLKALKINNHRMDQLPPWLGNKNFSIVSLELYNCSVKKLPPLGCLPQLENLIMKNFDKIEQIDGEFYGSGTDKVFPSLKNFHLYQMDMLREWKELVRISCHKSSIRYFPCLKELRIYSCHRLQALPKELPSSLKRLRIFSCDSLGLQALPKELPSLLEHLTINSCNNLEALPKKLPSSLNHLEISSCSRLQALPEKLPSSLNYLDIGCCSRLQALPEKLPSSLKELRIYSSLQALGKELSCSLEYLSICFCDSLQALPKELPPLLKYLTINSCNSLKALPEELPSSLEFLQIWWCSSLQDLPKKFPSSLEHLDIYDCNSLQALPEELPSSLKELTISSCSNLQALPEKLPSSLKKLTICSCSSLQTLPKELPSSLEHLIISYCSSFQALPKELPPCLKELQILSYSSFQTLPKEFPPSLKHLWISSCNNFQTLPMKLPYSLERLNIFDCNSLQALPKELPSSLNHLSIGTCNSLEALPKELHSSLKELTISSCSNFQVLPNEISSSLKKLEISKCSNFQVLPNELPSSLKELKISDCSNFQVLPNELPSSLKKLDIISCSNFRALPKKLPSSLKYLLIDSCSSLQTLPKELPSSLKYLNIYSCDNLQTLPKKLPSSSWVDIQTSHFSLKR